MSCLQTGPESGPAWFVEAIGDQGELREISVHGSPVSYRVWGPEGAGVVVLVHGGAAHGGWWDHIAPLMAAGRRVAVPDLTGHGSSGSRSEYDFRTWADEILAVGEAEGSAPPYVVGHSMGGVAAVTTAYRHAWRVAGAVVIDPPDWLVTGGLPPRRAAELPPRRFHPTRELAAERFRAKPHDDARLPYVERHVADRSVRQTDEGWTWRFDHHVTLHGSFPEELWEEEHCPLVLVLAERSLLAPEQARDLMERFDAAEVLTIRDAGHHVMLDQPLALLACLEGALAAWDSVGTTGQVAARRPPANN
jgi:pimeloyl-ACP methyl ester carboxylesterase